MVRRLNCWGLTRDSMVTASVIRIVLLGLLAYISIRPYPWRVIDQNVQNIVLVDKTQEPIGLLNF